MSASGVQSCVRRFTLLGGGRVRVEWGCGATTVEEDEAVDLDLLEDRAALWFHRCASGVGEAVVMASR